jgi:glucose dehydrogenase
MGVIFNTVQVPDLWHYEPEYNSDGTEKHITCDGARYHVLSWAMMSNGNVETHCSCANCEINQREGRE